MNLKDVGFLSASKFTRLSAGKLKELSPVTIVLDGDKPVCAVINYEAYLKLQAELATFSSTSESWKRRAAQHGCNVEEGDHECG